MGEGEIKDLVRNALDRSKEIYEASWTTEVAWRSMIFDFVRLLRFDPSIRGQDFDLATLAAIVEDVLADFVAADEDPWSVFDCDLSSGSIEAFLSLWSTVTTPVDYDPIEEASWMTDADCEWVYQTTNTDRASLRAYRRFISVVAHLQLLVGDKPIAIPIERIAACLGDRVDSFRVSAMRKNAEHDGILIRVEEPTSPSIGTAGRATTYRVQIDKLRRIPRDADTKCDV